METEEEDEREQDGAYDERRHGGGEGGAAALIGRQQQGRGMLLVPLHGRWALGSLLPLPPVLCSGSAPSAACCSSVVGLVMQLLPHLSYRKQGKQAAFFLLGSATAMEPSAPLLRLHQAGVE